MNPIFPDILSIPSKPEDLFELIECLNNNTNSKLYKAIHKTSNRIVLIKIINTSDSSQYNSIQSEISLLKTCTECSFIIKYYGSYFSICTNDLWIIYEYCDCSTVDLINATDRTFTENEIATIVEMILKALVFLHSNHLFYNDIVGDNVMLNKEGYVKLRNVCRLSKNGDGDGDDIDEERLKEKDIEALGRLCIELSEGERMEKDKEVIDEEFHSKDFNDFVKRCIKGRRIMDKGINALELMNHSFIKHYGKQKEYIANLIKYHEETIREYHVLMQEKVKMKLRESDKCSLLPLINKTSHKDLQSHVIDNINNDNDHQSYNSMIVNSINKPTEDNPNDASSQSSSSNPKDKKATPEFMKYINANNFIFDEKHYYESNKKNKDKQPVFNIDSFALPMKDLNKAIEEDPMKTLTHHSTQSIDNRRYSILMKYRNDNCNNRKVSGNPTTVTEHSSSKKASAFQFKSKDYKNPQHLSSLSIIDLIQDKDINSLPLSNLKQKLTDMTLDQIYELEYIDAKHNVLISKYTYAINLLQKYPNVKNIKEYIEVYASQRNIIQSNNYKDDDDDDDIMTHNKIISTSKVLDDDHDIVINRIPNLSIKIKKGPST